MKVGQTKYLVYIPNGPPELLSHILDREVVIPKDIEFWLHGVDEHLRRSLGDYDVRLSIDDVGIEKTQR